MEQPLNPCGHGSPFFATTTMRPAGDFLVRALLPLQSLSKLTLRALARSDTSLYTAAMLWPVLSTMLWQLYP